MTLCLFFSRKSFGRYGSFSSLKRYTSKTSLISAYDFIKEKVVPDSMRKKPGRNIWFLSLLSFPQNERKIYKLRQLKGQLSFVKVNIDGSALKKYTN